MTLSSELTLDAKAISVQFGGLLAVNNVTFTIPNKSVVSLIGPNGAGKTTTMRMILGLIKPDTGYAEIDGFRSDRDPDRDERGALRLRARVAALDGSRVLESQAQALRDDVAEAQRIGHDDVEIGAVERQVVVPTVPEDHVCVRLHLLENLRIVHAGVDDGSVHDVRLVFLDLLDRAFVTLEVGQRPAVRNREVGGGPFTGLLERLGQIAWRDLVPRAHQYGTFAGILEFTDVTGPAIGLERLHGLAR